MKTYDTIKINGVTLEVEYDYTPREAAGHWSPGWDEEIDLCAVTAGGFDILPLLSDETVEEVAKAISSLLDDRSREAENSAAYDDDWLQAA